MNIALFSNLFPNPHEPERGNFIALMTKKLSNKCSVHVLSPLPWFPNLGIFKHIPRLNSWRKYGEIPHQVAYENIEVRYPKYFFLPKVGFPLQPLSIYLASFKILKALYKQRKVDIINAHWIFPDAVAAVYMAKKLRVPCVISARGCDINRFSNSYARRIQINWALQHSDAITVVSNALKDKIIDVYDINEKKISIIPNGVDETIFHLMDQRKCRNTLKLDPNKKKLLFVGQLLPVKGLDTLLKALAILEKKKALTFETLIVGEGPLVNDLQNLAAELRLGPSDIIFKGQQHHTDVATYFGAADVLCLPSIREGRPNVIIEALSTGLPVVASNVGGIPELVNKNNGLLVTHSYPNELAQALEAAMNRTWDRNYISKNQTTSSWDSCADQYLDLFLKVIADKT